MLEPFARTYVTATVPGIDLYWLGNRHLAILDALEARDPTRAAGAMREHAKEAETLVMSLADSVSDPPKENVLSD